MAHISLLLVFLLLPSIVASEPNIGPVDIPMVDESTEIVVVPNAVTENGAKDEVNLRYPLSRTRSIAAHGNSPVLPLPIGFI